MLPFQTLILNEHDDEEYFLMDTGNYTAKII
jgi:hypothetical protein